MENRDILLNEKQELYDFNIKLIKELEIMSELSDEYNLYNSQFTKLQEDYDFSLRLLPGCKLRVCDDFLTPDQINEKLIEARDEFYNIRDVFIEISGVVNSHLSEIETIQEYRLLSNNKNIKEYCEDKIQYLKELNNAILIDLNSEEYTKKVSLQLKQGKDENNLNATLPPSSEKTINKSQDKNREKRDKANNSLLFPPR